ncbi:antibiotic biosynthesis monooxygenase [Lachnospiraceae bacterium Oil+RF-744-WCA-WT-11]|uniref:Antibiotic biosynthesis monooxygenase n=2 Tax=Porcincola intestinalis TaxID=2606632 RepID=A0A6L5X520_9FIRM|nr:antibiotic biosynthesis monooxygenase [Porcincola intestinalis]
MIMLKLIASNHIKKDQLEKFTVLAKELIMKSRAEEGNLSYSINVSLDDPCLFTFVEVWRDQKAFDIHNRTPHFTDIFPQIQAMSDKATPPTFYTELDA